MTSRPHIPLWRISRSSYRSSAASQQRKAHSCSRLNSLRSSTLLRQYRLNSHQSELSRSAILYPPTETMMAAVQRTASINLDEPIDLSTKTEKEIKVILKELHRRYTMNMVDNAQLDNEKQALFYQVEDMQDKLDEETHKKHLAASELKSWSRCVEEEKRRQLQLDFQINRIKEMISDRDQLIKDNNLVMVSIPSVSSDDMSSANTSEVDSRLQQVLHNSKENLLTLDQNIKKLLNENKDIRAQVTKCRQELNDVRDENLTKGRQLPRSQASTSSTVEIARLERDHSLMVAKQQQEITQANLKIDSLENQLLRLEAQMHRHREVYEDSERMKQRLKGDNRKISRQLDESNRRLEELQREYEHLEIRVEKVKNARDNALNIATSKTSKRHANS